MKVEQTKLDGCFTIDPVIYEDSRGLFYESYNAQKFRAETGIDPQFVQDNRSRSKYGVIRGLHMQVGEHAQAKLVSVLSGMVLDVAVDLRKNSKTFGNHVTVVLSSENRRQLFIPHGFAHGFAVLSEEADFFYKCDSYYNKDAELGVLYSDPDLAINWQIEEGIASVSEKDSKNRTFQEVQYLL